MATLFVGAAVWCVHHALAVSGLLAGAGTSRYALVYAVMFAVLIWQNALAYLERPRRATNRRNRHLNGLCVVGIVPAYNEDIDALRACVESMLTQSRKPQIVVVVNDGSTRVDYAALKVELIRAAELRGVRLIWIDQSNRGKRHAQTAAVRSTPEADVYWTCDSDGISDRHALEELLQHFTDPLVQSVAGVVLAANVHSSFLTRFTDLWFVTGQLVDRSSLSALSSVWVNSGPIAIYRAAVIRDNIIGYENETFNDFPVPFSDDSYLTLCAMLRGRTVQQPTAFVFSLMPEKVSHHLRQYDRWMRGSTIRSMWRFRYLATNRPAYWLHLARWAQMAIASVMFVVVIGGFVLGIGGFHWQSLAWLLGVPIAIGYAQALRYMVIRRSDQTPLYQWGTWMLTPVAALWAMTVMRAVRWYAMATVFKQSGWGTRTTVEVSLRETV